MKQHTTVQITKSNLESISIPNILYAEIAESGAMGNVGGIMIYSIEMEHLICYETSLFNDESMYMEVRKRLLAHQNGFLQEELSQEKILFDYHYGGMGNHVFIQKGIELDLKEGFFVYHIGEHQHSIIPSVEGVFNAVLHSIANSEK